MRKFFSHFVLMALIVPWGLQAQTTPAPASLPYTCGFEDASENVNWIMVGGTATNKFAIGTATNNGGSNGLYVSNDNGTTNAYTASSASYAFAYREFTVAATGVYNFSYDWKAAGETNYDYLRVFVIPDNADQAIVPFDGSTTIHTNVSYVNEPSSWITIDGGSQLQGSTSWQTYLSEEITLTAGTYKLAFYWRNDGGVAAQPSGAIDNISVSEVLCPRPSGLCVATVSSNSVTLSWNSTTSNNFKYVCDTVGAARVWSAGATVVNNDNTITVSNLQPNTAYNFYLQGLCGNDTTVWISASFRTTCLPIADDQLPYTESFETWSTGNFDQCYTATHNYSSTTNAPSVATLAHSHGLKSLYMSSQANYATWLSLPAFESDINELQLSFDMYKDITTDEYPMLVGIMGNPDDTATFDTIVTLRCSTSNRWQHFDIPLSHYQGNGTYITIMSPKGIVSNNYIDNIVVDFLPTCPDPMNLTAVATGENTASVYWAITSTEQQYKVEYGLQGFIPGTGTALHETTSADSVNLTSLDGNTLYDIYLRSECSSSYGNWVGPVSVRTGCSSVTDISTMPYMENFDSYTSSPSPFTYYSYNELPQCWNIYSNGTNGPTNDYYPRIYKGESTASPVMNNNCLITAVMHSTSSSYQNQVAQRGTMKMATLPTFSEPLHNVTISFDVNFYPNSSSYKDTLFMAIATTDSTYIPLTYINSNNGGVAQHMEVDLSNYSTTISAISGGRLALVHKAGTYSTSTIRYCGIDNVKVEKNSTCKKPYNGRILATTATTAAYIFNDSVSGGSYEIAVGTVNNIAIAADDASNYADTTGNITGLTPGTTYYAWARKQCTGTYSGWIELGNFTTKCNTFDTLPYVENFDGYVGDVSMSTGSPETYPNHTLPQCWTFLNLSDSRSTYPQAFITSETSYADSANALMFKAKSNSSMYAVLPKFNTNIELLQVTFSYRNNSVSTSDGVLSIGVMTNPDDPATFIALREFDQKIEFTDVEYPFFADTVTGNEYHIAFRYKGGTSNGNSFALDNVVVSLTPECRRSINLVASNVTANSTDLSWANGSGDSYIVAYSTTRNFNPDSCTTRVTSTSNSITLTGLNAYTEYFFAVKAVCGSENGRWSEIATFITTPDCGNLSMIEPMIGNITLNNTNSSIPIYSNYWNPYGASYQLFTREELEAQGLGFTNVINSVAYRYKSAADMTADINIYMANTTMSSLTIADTMPLSQMTLVYSGSKTFTSTETWSNIILNTPYTFGDGTSNLLIVVERSSSFTGPNNAYFNTYSSGNSSIIPTVVVYTDQSGNRNASTLTGRNDILFNICTIIPDCPTPDSLKASNLQPTQALVQWTSNAASYDIAYGLSGFNLDSTATYQVVQSTSTNITLTGLTSNERYDVYVRAHCDSSVMPSMWSDKISFKLPCFPVDVPFNEDFNRYTEDVSRNTTAPTTYPAHALPDCWNVLNMSETSDTYPKAFLTSSATYTQGGNSFLIISKKNASIYAILPKMNASIDSLMLSFSYRNAEGVATANGVLTIGVMSDIADSTSFIPLESMPLTTVMTRAEHVFSLDTVTGTNYHIAFRYKGGTSSNYWLGIDNVVVNYAPTCPKVADLQVLGTTQTTAELSWTSEADSWIVEYGPVGFNRGTGTAVVADSVPFTLTGLQHSSMYDYYVRPICGTTDTGAYNRYPAIIQTLCGTNSIPWVADLDGYWEDLGQNKAHPMCWSLVDSGNTSYNWRKNTDETYVHTGDNSLKYYGTTGTSTLHNDWMITPELNLSGNEQLTFWMRNTSASTTASYTARVAIYAYTASANDTTFSTNDFVCITPLRITMHGAGANIYEEHIIPLTGLTGNVRLAFVVDTNSYTFYIDDISVDTIPACQKPFRPVVDSVAPTAVTLSWESDANSFVVEYKSENNTTWTAVTCTTTSTTVSGLVPNSTYSFRVKAICDSVNSSVWSNIVEATTACGPQPLPFAEDFSSSSFPGTCWTRMSGDLLAGTATVVSSGWNYSSTNTGIGSPHAKFNIYSTSRYSLITPELDLTQIPNAQLKFDFSLTKYGNAQVPDSVYDDDKFMVAISTDGGATWLDSNAVIWCGDSTADYLLRDVVDSTQHVVISLAKYYGETIKIAFFGGSTVANSDLDLHLDNISVREVCPAPMGVNAVADVYAATISWDSVASDIQIEYREATAEEWSREITVSNATSYTITDLLAETAYQYRVRSACDDNDYSIWTVGTFTTLELVCVVPTDITASEITNNSAVISWQEAEYQTSWEVRYRTQGSDITLVSNEPTITLTDLYYGQSYEVWVRAYCGDELYSDWSEPITFNTLSCSPIHNLGVVSVGLDYAIVSWLTDDDQSEWEVIYGFEGFAESNGNKVTVDQPNYTINGLESGATYDVYVRTKCGKGFYSVWSEKVTFTIPVVGINSADDNMLHATIYPNPATKEAKVSVEGVMGKVEIIVSDINGRTLIQDEFVSDGQLSKSINVEQWAKGTYFVRIINNESVAVQKLVVR